ncbi:cyclic nucleotide-binding domain protein (macronuclear) [Tetrahymena thermophila SB210]|uniref:Cyclic nucleotide-binding domain protein n=1 Tax=Tetrahymena thermophila (strain SB210) TaxID=312017 RepID=Q24DT1_TETTS|nr:cyclic nucleotide-binding domain protein [Tetrahymena thermophila SB210]EAS05909.2 cyclic nucleotide-binding domain protein [Tetrahymena thermophila SB210]|eukprot:XP_001026154.2 cyclic nucleotide-binding domain protein [Tetrahymena thermophila SB210]
MDVRRSFPLVRQNQHVMAKNQQCQRGMKRSKDQAFQFVNLIQQVTQILSKERAFRTKEEVSLVAIVIKQSNFFKFYEKEFEKSPSALKQIVESMSYESYIAGQEIYTEKDRAKKVYIVLSGDVCILSQKIKKDKFKNISNQNKSGGSEQFNLQQQMKLKSFLDSELLLEKSFSHSFNQFKQLESISQYDFFGDTDVRYLSKNSFSAVAKTRVECAVIPQEVFNIYLGETSEIALQVKEMLKCSLFKFLDPQYVEYCLKYSKEIIFPKQKIIFKEGENSSEVYYIKQGDIELSATLPKQSDQEIKVEDIETNIAAQHDHNENEMDSFDPDKFIKSNLFNQTLYEKGGPVSKNRQFWNQGDTEGQDYITKLKEQLDFKCKQFQQRGIQYTQIKVEDQVKKFMIASLSNKFQDKGKGNFISQAINRNVNCGLKLALLSKGGYFGEEVIFQHPLMHQENSNSGTISPYVKENKKQKSQNYFFDELKINSKQHENENNKHKNNYFLVSSQKDGSKNNQNQEQELDDNISRQYTVKCQSASCILLKIEMELYLSLIYLNQKQSQAKKYLESQLKQERRQLKLKNHLNLILKPNKIFTQQNEIDQAPSSIKGGKSIQFFTNSVSNQQLVQEDSSTPNSKKLELSQKLNMSHSFSNQFYSKKQDIIDSSSSTFPSTDKNQLFSQTKNFQSNEIRQKNNSECFSVPSQLNQYQINKIKQRNSIDKINLTQSQDLQNQESVSTYIQGKKGLKNNNSLQQYRQNHQNNLSQQDFSDMFGSYMQQESQIQKKNVTDLNLKQQKQGINKSKTAQKQSQMREEIDNLYYTFSSILQKEENRQRQISLMTNTLEKICNNNYYNKNVQKDNQQQQGLSITLPNQSLSEQKEFQFLSPIQSATKGVERVFFSSHYPQLSQLINYSNNDNNTTGDLIKKNISFTNQALNTKLSLKKQALDQSKDFASQSEQINPIIQKQKFAGNCENLKIKSDVQKNQTREESQQQNKQIENQFNESRESFKSKLISSSTNENEQNPKSISFQSKEHIQNNQKEDFNVDQEKVFVFDQQNSQINNQTSFLQNSFISIQEDDKDQQLLQTNNSQQENISQKKFLIRDKNVFIYPKKYVLQPLFSEIIENEVERLQQSEQKKQNERIKIEINQDFYIKRYRKAYKEAFDLVKRPEKKQVNSIFDELENSSEKQNKKQKQENLSLIIQKKFQIDKQFPNSQRAKEINDFFSNHIKKLDEQHKSKLDKFKREKDINAIITKQLVYKLEQQNIKRRNDLNYAGTNFNFILKDADKKNSLCAKNNNISHENQNQKQVK